MKDLQIITDKIDSFNNTQLRVFQKDLEVTLKEIMKKILKDLIDLYGGFWVFSIDGDKWSYVRDDVDLNERYEVVRNGSAMYGECSDMGEVLVVDAWSDNLIKIDEVMYKLTSNNLFNMNFLVSVGFVETRRDT